MLRIGVIMYQTSLTKGQELTAQRMVREFRMQGYDSFLITSVYHDWEPVVQGEELAKRGGYVHVFDERLGIPVIRVRSTITSWPPRRISFVDFMATLTSIVDDLKLNVLITHSTLWNGPEEVLKFMEWRRKMARSGAPGRDVIFCHMAHFQEPSDDRYLVAERSFRQAWNEVSLSRIVSQADLVLVTTPREKETMKSFGAQDSKCFLFPGGIEDISESPGDREFFSKHGIPNGKRVVSVLGTVEERKNLSAVLKVAEKLLVQNDVHFVIAGRLEGEYGEKVREEAAGLRNVSVTGEITEDEKVALIKESYVNLTMSRAEALGLSQLEFMLCGVPVVSSGTGGQSWLVSDGRNGVLLKGPDDVDGAVSAIIDLVRHRSRRDKMGREARKFAHAFLMTRLIHSLSKSLEAKVRELGEEDRLPKKLAADERIIDSWVSGRVSVAATNRRLIIWGRHGEHAVTIPYSEMTSITRHVRLYWQLLAVGAAASLALALGRLYTPWFETWLMSLLLDSPLFSSGPVRFFLSFMLPFIPIAVSSMITFLTVVEGFLVHRAGKKPVFLEREFVKALRLADKLTPNELFAEPGSPS